MRLLICFFDTREIPQHFELLSTLLSMSMASDFGFNTIDDY